MLAGSMPKVLIASTLVDTATKCFASASSGALLQEPGARGVRVHHGLGRGEGLRGDDEEGGFRIHARQRGVHVVAVDVRDEVHGQARMGELAQRQADHLRAEVGAADADVDDVGDLLAGMAQPGEPLRTLSLKVLMRSSTACTSAVMSWPSRLNGLLRGARRAVCRTARFSVRLIFSPANIASRRRSTPRSRASCASSSSVRPSRRFFE
jgi:hypothetical protein